MDADRRFGVWIVVVGVAILVGIWIGRWPDDAPALPAYPVAVDLPSACPRVNVACADAKPDLVTGCWRLSLTCAPPTPPTVKPVTPAPVVPAPKGKQ